jgi:hypothetical protein
MRIVRLQRGTYISTATWAVLHKETRESASVRDDRSLVRVQQYRVLQKRRSYARRRNWRRKDYGRRKSKQRTESGRPRKKRKEGPSLKRSVNGRKKPGGIAMKRESGWNSKNESGKNRSEGGTRRKRRGGGRMLLCKQH